MNRRSLLISSLAIAATGIMAQPSRASVSALGPFGPMRAWVANPQIVKQDCPQWCWAASISMIFAAYGHPVKQEKIVQRTYGSLVCLPSGNPLTIPANLSQTWIDDNGETFTSTVVAAYDPMNNVQTLFNPVIVDELANDRPLLYCNRHHAMVLVAADYVPRPWGTQILAGGVLDPWPESPDFHPLTQMELLAAGQGGEMMFLGTVRIS
jgi:hypothetical protein